MTDSDMLESGSDPTSQKEPGNLSAINLLIVLARHKKMITSITLGAALIALVVSTMLPSVFVATARILPPHQRESTAIAMLGNFAGAAGPGSAAVGQALGLRNPNDLFAGILKSRTIADRLIEKFSLKDLYRSATMVDARRELAERSRISAGRDGLIAIAVEDTDPRRASEIANGYVSELDRLMQSLAITEAAQRRLFFEKQLAKAREQLVGAEITLRRSIEAKGLVGIDAQSRAVVATTEQLRAQIAVKEIQLDAMRSFATNSNPEAVRLRQEIASMRTELASLEGGRVGASRDSPSGLENVRKLRDLKFVEHTVELLTKQYEIARIDEAKDAVVIQIVDKAIPPDHKSKPKRAVIVIATTLVFGLLAVLLAFGLDMTESIRKDPEGVKRINELRNHLRWR